jgi:hypothetical protein
VLVRPKCHRGKGFVAWSNAVASGSPRRRAVNHARSFPAIFRYISSFAHGIFVAARVRSRTNRMRRSWKPSATCPAKMSHPITDDGQILLRMQPVET